MIENNGQIGSCGQSGAEKARYSLSDFDHFDLAMKYCFDKRILDFADIDEVLKTCDCWDQLFLAKPKKK